MNRLAKTVTVILGASVVIAGVAVGTLYVKAQRSLPALQGDVAAAGLGQPVRVSRDTQGMPLIEAANLDDAMYSLGFLHAQERYFQMDIMRRKAAGELAELLGSRALDADKLARIHRFRSRAKTFVAGLPADQRTLLRHYVAGVNAGLNQLSSAPFEYAMLFATPAPWTEEDTMLVNSALYLMLQTQKEALHPERARDMLVKHYDVEFADFILAARSEWDTPMQEGEPKLVDKLPKLITAPRAVAASLAQDEIDRLQGIRGINRATENIIGSNSWVVSGRKGVDGRAVLANDMHLPLQQPNTFYRFGIRLAGGGHTIAGVGVPGIPVMVAGSNGTLAWGLTNANGDWSDLVRLNKTGGAVHGSTASESINVKWGSPVTLAVRETPWGPVVASDPQADYAMSWVAHHPQGNNLALFGLMRAGSIEEAMTMAAGSGMPHMNIVFADRHGAAAWTIAGRIPRRTGFPGNASVEWSDKLGWSGWLEPADYPALTSAERDYFWTANNRIVSGADWAKLGVGAQFALGVRARRIEERLKAGASADEKAMHALQLDDTALLMQRWHALLVKLVDGMAESADKQQIAEVLATWNGRASVDSAAYRVVRRFRDEVADDIMPSLLKELLKNEPELKWYMVTSNWETPLWRVLSQQPAAALPAGHASWNAYFQDVLMRKVFAPYSKRYDGKLSKATWSDANMASIQHPLSKSVPLIGALLDMPSVPMNGDSNTVLAQSQSFGPAMRLVVSPGNEAAAYLTMPAGQAGNPLSPYYRGGHAEWQDGKTLPLLPGTPRYVLQLMPVK